MKQNAGTRTRKKILDAALNIYPDTSVTGISIAANMSHSAVTYHFKAEELKQAIIDHAVKTENAVVIVQLIAQKDKSVAHLTASDRATYFRAI